MPFQHCLPAILLLTVISGAAACESSSQERNAAPSKTGPAVPELAAMTLARPVGKLGVPVEVRYQLAGTAAKNQAATLQLAFVPRVEGSNLKVEYPDSDSVSVETQSSAPSVAKAQTTGVYRQTLLVTPRKADAGEVRAIVSMDIEGGRYFSVFTIPLSPAPAPAKAR